MKPFRIGIGFLVGMSLWTPFLVTTRIELRLARLEDRIAARTIRATHRSRTPTA